MSVAIVQGRQALENLTSQPANVLLYGPPGSEKTTDAVKAFCTPDNTRCNAFVITCEDGALKPIPARGLPAPDHTQQPVKTWGDMTEVMHWLAQNRQHYTGVIIDTLSTFMMYLNKEVEEQYKTSKNKYLVWTTMRSCLFTIREWIRGLGLHSVMICHALEPVVLDGVFHRGGPLLSPKSMIENYYGLIDTVLRVDFLDSFGKRERVYWTGGNTWPAGAPGVMPPDAASWRCKNREGCGDAIVPADLGAFLRGRNPPYPGL